ncbi:MAG: ParB/RepB/Spo0J family partition protein [Phycisphaeraceae bacterium]
MNIRSTPLSSLIAHPLNSNVMSEPLLKKLAAHIERSGRYPPVIVRAAPREGASGTETTAVMSFQILDGHHRVEVLRRLKHRVARCVVWDVDDAEAELLLATLNRLQGHDDPYKRAALLKRMRERLADDLQAMASRLPEQARDLKALLELASPPSSPRGPRSLDELPVAVHFFLLSAQRKVLDACLRRMGGSREAALMRLVEVGRPHGPESVGFEG